MDTFRELKNTLTWHSADGKFDVVMINGIITHLNFCEIGTSTEDCRCLVSTDYKFLKQVHQCLGELFDFIEAENKRLGYSYADEPKTEIKTDQI